LNIYNQAIQVQDACNLSGVVHTLWNDILPAIREEAKRTFGGGTEWINGHVVVRLFAYKISSLVGRECLCDYCGESYKADIATCEKHAD